MASTQLYNQDPLIDPIPGLTNSIKMSVHPNSVLPTNDKGLAYNFVNDTSNSANLMNTAGLSDNYVKNLRVGSDGNVYNDSINDMFTTMKAEQGFKAGPTVENAKLFNSTNDGDSTIFGLDNKQWNSIGQLGNFGLAAGQLGLGVMSYFDNIQTANKQRRLLNQQYENNKDLIADRKANKAALSKLHIN